jgi:hypothetical protein
VIIGEAQPAALQMLAQDMVLFFQVVDHHELLPVDPTREQQEQELERTALHGAAWYRRSTSWERSQSLGRVRHEPLRSPPSCSIEFFHTTASCVSYAASSTSASRKLDRCVAPLAASMFATSKIETAKASRICAG